MDGSALGLALKHGTAIVARAQVRKMRKSFKTFIIMPVKGFSSLRCIAKASFSKVYKLILVSKRSYKNPLHWSIKDCHSAHVTSVFPPNSAVATHLNVVLRLSQTFHTSFR